MTFYSAFLSDVRSLDGAMRQMREWASVTGLGALEQAAEVLEDETSDEALLIIRRCKTHGPSDFQVTVSPRGQLNRIRVVH